MMNSTTGGGGRIVPSRYMATTGKLQVALPGHSQSFLSADAVIVFSHDELQCFSPTR